MNIQNTLLGLNDGKFKAFHSKLIPTVDKNKIIGIKTPVLRSLAKDIINLPECELFLKSLPHKYYEEDNLHGLIINQINNYNEVISYLNDFLPFVDNWATCDLIRPKAFKKQLSKLLEQIMQWINSEQTFTVRFGIEMLMVYFLDEPYFDVKFNDTIANIRSDEYYINMMIAWYFATALAKQYKATLPYLEKHSLDKWTHNKTIQKAIESYRVSDEQKTYLRTLKIK